VRQIRVDEFAGDGQEQAGLNRHVVLGLLAGGWFWLIGRKEFGNVKPFYGSAIGAIRAQVEMTWAQTHYIKRAVKKGKV
jgi:hypothetical protein